MSKEIKKEDREITNMNIECKQDRARRDTTKTMVRERAGRQVCKILFEEEKYRART